MAADTATLTKGRTVAASSAKRPVLVKGRREFFKYRDLGVTAGSKGHMRAQVTAADAGMSQPTGWHYHICDSQLVYVLKGWLELEFADGPVRLEAGDSIYIPGGTPHNETRTADAFEILEVSVPAEMATKPCDAPAR
jgi:quercetin dioxygenase-like cupin family protein